MTEALTRTDRGDGQFIVVGGEPGIGKSRLLEVMGTLAEERGDIALRAAGDQLEVGFPFGVVRQLLEPTLAALPAAEQRSVFGGSARQAAGLLGRAPTSAVSGDAEMYVYLDALLELICRLSSRHPLVLLVDDAQWADSPSLRFLSFLTRRLAGVSVLVMAVVRRDEAAGRDALTEHLADTPGAQLLTPRPLSVEGVTAMLGNVLEGAVAEPFAVSCHAATGGIPFFVGELVQRLKDADIDPSKANVVTVETMSTDNIERAVRSRLSRLPESATRLARAVALLGSAANLRAATAVAQLSVETGAEMVDLLAAARIVDWRPPLRLAHPIVGAAVAASIPPATRSSLHARSAEVLAAAGAPDEQVAAHIVSSDPKGDPERISLLVRAARAASSRGAPEHAARYLRRALDEPPALADRGALLHELGWAQLRAGQPEGEQKLRDSLALARNAEDSARVSLRLGRALVGRGDVTSAVDVFDRAIAALGSADPDLAAELELDAITAALLGSRTTAAHRGRIMDFERRHRGEGESLAISAYLAAMANEPADTVARSAQRALGQDNASRRRGDGAGPLVFHALCALIWCERFTVARPVLQRALARARAGGSTPEMLVCLFVLTLLEVRQGRLREVEELGQAALEIGALDPAHLNMRGVTANLTDARVERGDLTGAAAALAVAGPLDDSLQSNLLLHARARTTLATGNHQAALDDLHALKDRLACAGSDAPWICDWRTTAALAHLGLGEHTAARPLLEQQLTLARAARAPRVLGTALVAAARAESHGPGREAMLREAVVALEVAEAPLALAHGLLELGSELRHRRRAVDARVPLTRAEQIATRCGAAPLRARAIDELAATGGRRRHHDSSEFHELTASEHRTATLAAEGLTNREIAQRLYVSVKTVETQLSSSFRKLQISSRKQLPTALEGLP
jgi:DNA-binding CsgD family transcriptional regulator/tetratricopeptide (TPR) repeat protein